jgi:hypothetical protein
MAALNAPGEMRRTRLQQVPAAIWFESATEARVVCFRSVARTCSIFWRFRRERAALSATIEASFQGR